MATSSDIDQLHDACARLVERGCNAIIKKLPWGFVIMPTGNGFTIVAAERSPGRIEISLGAWSDDIFLKEQALELIADSLKGRARVRHIFMNEKPWKQIVEYDVPSIGWVAMHESGFPRLSLFRRRLREELLMYDAPVDRT